MLFGDNVILITGIPRSRTSLTAAILDKCGADFGNPKDFKPANKYNPLGYYEHKGLIKKLVNPYWSKIGFHPLDRVNMPSKKDVMPDSDWGAKFKTIMGTKKYNIAVKEPKLCLYWEVWHYAFPDAKWILVRRPRAEVMESISNRTPWMKNTLTEQEYNTYIDHHLKRMAELKSEANCFEVHTDQFIAGNFDEIKQCVKWCGLTWNDKAKELVKPEYTYQGV